MANSVDLDEVAHHEPSHHDLCCLQIRVFSSLILKKKLNAALFSFFFLILTMFSISVARST